MAEKRKGFDLAAVLGSVSDLNTGNRQAPGQEQIEYIDIGLLDSDQRNFYQLSDIDDLADNIQLCGLQQPIRVRASGDGRYTIVSGHRRRAALAQLVDQGLAQFRRVPCIQETDDASPALQELRLIFANSSTRKLTSAEIGEQAERVEALLYQLKEEGYEFPEGRMRDVVATACNTHGSKLGRIKVIRSRLVSEFTVLWQSGQLPEQSAYTLAKFPAAMQSRIAAAFPQVPSGTRLERLLHLYKDESYRWEPDLACPDGKPCKRGDAFLRHDADCMACETCGGKTCCLDCRSSQAECYACDKACSKAKAIRKEKMDGRKAAQKAAEDKRQKRLERETAASAARLVRAADAANVPDNATVVFDRYGGSFTAGELRAIAAGTHDWRCRYTNCFAPDNLSDIGKAAKALHCSADYIVGLTNDLQPPTTVSAPPEHLSPQFVDGRETPTRSGRCYCRFDCEGEPIHQLAWWDSYIRQWLFRQGGVQINAKCLAWFPLPSEDDGTAAIPPSVSTTWQTMADIWPEEGSSVLLCRDNGIGGFEYQAAVCVGPRGDRFPFEDAGDGLHIEDWEDFCWWLPFQPMNSEI